MRKMKKSKVVMPINLKWPLTRVGTPRPSGRNQNMGTALRCATRHLPSSHVLKHWYIVLSGCALHACTTYPTQASQPFTGTVAGVAGDNAPKPRELDEYELAAQQLSVVSVLPEGRNAKRSGDTSGVVYSEEDAEEASGEVGHDYGEGHGASDADSESCSSHGSDGDSEESDDAVLVCEEEVDKRVQQPDLGPDVEGAKSACGDGGEGGSSCGERFGGEDGECGAVSIQWSESSLSSSVSGTSTTSDHNRGALGRPFACHPWWGRWGGPKADCV